MPPHNTWLICQRACGVACAHGHWRGLAEACPRVQPPARPRLPSRYSTRMHQTRIALGTWVGDFPGASDQQGHLPRPTGAFRINGGIFRTSRGGVFRTSPRPTGVLAGPTRTCSGPEEAEGGLTWRGSRPTACLGPARRVGLVGETSQRHGNQGGLVLQDQQGTFNQCLCAQGQGQSPQPQGQRRVEQLGTLSRPCGDIGHSRLGNAYIARCTCVAE